MRKKAAVPTAVCWKSSRREEGTPKAPEEVADVTKRINERNDFMVNVSDFLKFMITLRIVLMGDHLVRKFSLEDGRWVFRSFEAIDPENVTRPELEEGLRFFCS